MGNQLEDLEQFRASSNELKEQLIAYIRDLPVESCSVKGVGWMISALYSRVCATIVAVNKHHKEIEQLKAEIAELKANQGNSN